jgi:maltose alpha-D-glucosyltransferase/alpha-amylase
LWLLPFYQSPLRDGGYDISDFWTVLPEYGDLADAVELVEQAHKRGLRVIADLVMNHTSNQHPWFVESRQDRTNPKADWYVWSDGETRYPEARVIFVDTEKSNWTFDAQRGQYYWHRFFSHQPDLNYDNPEVADTMMDVVRYWLDIGLDGFRLDAVPYLFERDGTNGENFGDGDECHMCFHFPVMPRMFMAVRREQRHPLSEILTRTPAIPDGCQWGMFLRNHDELTLEMVTDEERDYMWTEYAKDPRMKRNLGIGRRLAPLVDNDRRVAELLHAMLFSFPGSPVLYYGDEIGMGDNIYLGDRDAVRTPMQWSPDRNAGFGRADFAQLYLPPLMDPVYGYPAVNVEAQMRDTSSQLHWMRRMLEVRRQHSVFGTGRFEVISVENPSVLAYVRTSPTQEAAAEPDTVSAGPDAWPVSKLIETAAPDVVLCVCNLSRFAQPAELPLQRWAGQTPIELLGRVPFPRIGELPYFVTLAPYGFYWFQLVDPYPLGLT